MLQKLKKAFFTDREVLDLIRETPLVQDALQARIDAEGDRELQERLRVLDALDDNASRMREVNAKIEAQQPRHDKAHQAWRVEADKLGALVSEREQLQRREGDLCCQLSQHGEAPLDRALMQSWEGVANYGQQIRQIESDLATVRRDVFDSSYPAWRARKVAELEDLKRRLHRNQQAIQVLTPWVAARISPREQTERVNKLMASLG